MTPVIVRVIHDRLRYRWNNVPFNQNLIVVHYGLKKLRVASKATGLSWTVLWKDVKIIQFV